MDVDAEMDRDIGSPTAAGGEEKKETEPKRQDDRLLDALEDKLRPLTEELRDLRLKVGTLNSTLTRRLNQLETKLDRTTLRVDKLEELLKDSSETDTSVKFKLGELEKQLAELKAGGLPDTTERACTAVLGGLGGLSKEEAQQWMKDKLEVAKGPQPEDIYCKGDFKGLLFAKFATKVDRDKAVGKFRQAKLENLGEKVWAKPDKPVEKRVPEMFLFGLKKTMVQTWGWNKFAVWVDEAELTLKAEGELVVTASVVEGSGSKKLVCDWNGEWATWQQLQRSSELAQLLLKAEETLGKTSGNKGKGKNGNKGN